MLFDASKFIPLDPSQEPIFPPQLKVNLQGHTLFKIISLSPSLQLSTSPRPLAIHGPRVQWYCPVTLPQLLALRDQFPQHRDRSKPQYRLVVGNTEIGVEVRLKGAHYPVLIAPTRVPELHVLEMTNEGLLVGAAVVLTDLQTKLQELISSLPGLREGLY